MKGTAIVNFFFRVILGAGFFWVLYLLLNVKYYDIIGKIAIVVLISTGASLTALMLSYLIISIALVAMKKDHVSFESLTGNKIEVDVLYEMIAIIFNSIAVAGGVIMLKGQSANFYLFFLYYIGMKIGIRICAYALAHAILKHLVAIIFTFMLFMMLCFSAVMILYLNPPKISLDSLMIVLDDDLEGSLW